MDSHINEIEVSSMTNDRDQAPFDEQISDEQLEQISGGKTVPDDMSDALESEAEDQLDEEGGLKGLFRRRFFRRRRRRHHRHHYHH
ncbi:MAG: hypothetical protein AAFQ57_07870 [Cyanobacteria bacterium J06626_14]